MEQVQQVAVVTAEEGWMRQIIDQVTDGPALRLALAVQQVYGCSHSTATGPMNSRTRPHHKGASQATVMPITGSSRVVHTAWRSERFMTGSRQDLHHAAL